MGTRGAFGVRIDGQDKVTYNHFDSYPDGLGEELIKQAKKMLRDPGLDGMRDLARKVRLINRQTDKPTAEDKRRLKRYADLGVSDRSDDDWYCLTRNMQGDIAACLKTGIMIDGRSFLNDSLFCEYAYVINLDDETFEVYRGFQDQKHKSGRYASDVAEDGYYPVALAKAFPLPAIPKDWGKCVEDEEEAA